MAVFSSLSDDGAPSKKFLTVSSIILKQLYYFLRLVYIMAFILTGLVLQVVYGGALKER
jgi:hypothetical protein